MPVLPLVGSMMCVSGCQPAGFFCRLDHGATDAVFHAAARVEELQLHQHRCRARGHDAIELHQGGVVGGGDDVANKFCRETCRCLSNQAEIMCQNLGGGWNPSVHQLLYKDDRDSIDQVPLTTGIFTKAMPTIESLSAFLEEFAPPRLAESWDNVGLLVGDRQDRGAAVDDLLDGHAHDGRRGDPRAARI